MKAIRRTRRRSAGISLIEVMISIVVLSIGLLGLVALQARATQVSMGAEDSSRAALLASELASTMWTTRTANLASSVVTTWQTQVANPATGGLPNGVGTVTLAGTVATITITWRPPSATADSRYVTQVLVP
jgi:type IV pilus assembly protein PilV